MIILNILIIIDHHRHHEDHQALRESEEEARLREEGVDDVESIGVDPLDERFGVADDHDIDCC